MYSIICSNELLVWQTGINSVLNLVQMKNIGFIASNWRNIAIDTLRKTRTSDVMTCFIAVFQHWFKGNKLKKQTNK
jgi:hypothetical protein